MKKNMKICVSVCLKFRKIFYMLALFLLMFFLSFKVATSVIISGILQSRMMFSPLIKSYKLVLVEPNYSYRTKQQNIQLNNTISTYNENKTLKGNQMRINLQIRG
ncbi:hypothetical protein EDEG_03302 [Edhazardia aedis USNM 41457]|uniref:Uncharacterized protein n=1 Tax=Edhazardia aedis (strain USNM 41457) TaxID=1003232 RepID=J9D3Y9_EDHAE|nr:hypothetical protein EDEG_03302 [Edhazardia aedis USNM 41457]|eukprot:EJW02259.1 hypothetical protein EDEG_03302 [Edhazardia aedis USNM 41457]